MGKLSSRRRIEGRHQSAGGIVSRLHGPNMLCSGLEQGLSEE